MAGRGGARAGAGRKPVRGEFSRLQLRLDTNYLREIDLACGRLRDARNRPLTRADFFRQALPALLGELSAGEPFPTVDPGASDHPFPLELPLALRRLAEQAVDGGLAPSLAELVRAAGGRLARQVLTAGGAA